MNEALVQWGYPQDAILNNTVSTLFAKQLNARTMVFSVMNREQDGRFSVTTRFAGVNDDAGYVVRQTQSAGETLEDFAKELADQFKDPIRAYKDAKECTTLAQTPDKQRDAVRAAEKALKRVPNQGLAEVCLAEMAKGHTSRATMPMSPKLRKCFSWPLCQNTTPAGSNWHFQACPACQKQACSKQNLINACCA